MRLSERRVIDQALVAEEPCLGAVFCSYTFDPAYFEDHVLRSLLRLRGDPGEDAARYHEEARRALLETPVTCLVDASVRQSGRRLPYDLLLVRRRTFHPKVILVLYGSEARLAIGSGNMTRPGLEQNTELFFVRGLRYDDPSDAALLRDVDGFLGESAELAGNPGTQLELVRKALAGRLQQTPRLDLGQRTEFMFVSSFGGRLLDRLDGAMHGSARITRVGILAPFFERDDLGAGGDEGLPAVLAELLALRPSPGAVLDVGVPWDDAPLAAAPTAKPPSLDEQAGRLWAWRRRENIGGKPVERLDYLRVETATAKRIQVTNAAGEACRYDRDMLQAEISEARLWPVAKPTIHAPDAILRQLASSHDVSLWLHPTSQLTPSGHAVRRPLHAKAVLVTTQYQGRVCTYVLAGSANASRSALALSVAQGGNVEAGMLCQLNGEVTLRDLLPALVSCSLDGVNLLERESLPLTPDLSAWVEEVLHDAAARTLHVAWRSEGPSQLGAWSLHYLDRELGSGIGVPGAPAEFQGFDLDPGSAEVTFAASGLEWQLPIRVLDLAALPTSPQLASLGLRELLALLGRRVGSERLATLQAQRGPSGVASALDAVFGEGFGPSDVFRAWWGAVEDLQTALTVAGFRHRLVGPTGVRTAWLNLRAAGADEISPDEAWVYGCELLRELRGMSLPVGPDHEAKRALLDDFLRELGTALDQLAPDARDRSWIGVVSRFYGLGGGDART